MYKGKADKRNTSKGMTPNKIIRRPTNSAPKKVSKMQGRSRGK